MGQFTFKKTWRPGPWIQLDNYLAAGDMQRFEGDPTNSSPSGSLARVNVGNRTGDDLGDLQRAVVALEAASRTESGTTTISHYVDMSEFGTRPVTGTKDWGVTRIGPRETTLYHQAGNRYGITPPQEIIPIVRPPGAIGYEWSTGRGTPVKAYVRASGQVMTGSSSVAGGWGHNTTGTWTLELGARPDSPTPPVDETGFVPLVDPSAVGDGRFRWTHADNPEKIFGYADVTNLMDPATGRFVVMGRVDIEVLSANYNQFTGAGFGVDMYMPVRSHLGYISGSQWIIEYEIQPPLFRWIFDDIEGGDGESPIEADSGPAVTDIYGVMGDYAGPGDGDQNGLNSYVRMFHWKSDGTITYVNTLAKWGRAAGPMCRLPDGRLFVYDAGTRALGDGSLGYFVDAELETIEPWTPTYPIDWATYTLDAIKHAWYSCVHYRQETDRIWVSSQMAHEVTYQPAPVAGAYGVFRYDYTLHEFDLEGKDLKHVWDLGRYGGSGVRFFYDLYALGKFYRSEWGYDLVRYDPETGALDYAVFGGSAQRDWVYGKLMGATPDGRLIWEAYNDDLNVTVLQIMNPDDCLWVSAAYNFTSPPYSDPPATNVPGIWSGTGATVPAYNWMDRDHWATNTHLYYVTYKHPAEQYEDDLGPSGYAIIQLDLATGAWETVHNFPNQVAEDFWIDDVYNLVVVTETPGQLKGGPLDNRRAFWGRGVGA